MRVENRDGPELGALLDVLSHARTAAQLGDADELAAGEHVFQDKQIGSAHHVRLAAPDREQHHGGAGIADDEADIPAQELRAPGDHLLPAAVTIDHADHHGRFGLVGQIGLVIGSHEDDGAAALHTAEDMKLGRVVFNDGFAKRIGIDMRRAAACPGQPVRLDLHEIVERLGPVSARQVAIAHRRIAGQMFLQEAADQPRGAVGPAAGGGSKDDLDRLALEIDLGFRLSYRRQQEGSAQER